MTAAHARCRARGFRARAAVAGAEMAQTAGLERLIAFMELPLARPASRPAASREPARGAVGQLPATRERF